MVGGIWYPDQGLQVVACSGRDRMGRERGEI